MSTSLIRKPYIDEHSFDAYKGYETISEARVDARRRGVEIRLYDVNDVDLDGSGYPYAYGPRWEIDADGNVEVIEW